MAILKPDKKTTLGGVTVNEFLLTKHNSKNIAMPSVKMEGIIGITVHNTDCTPLLQRSPVLRKQEHFICMMEWRLMADCVSQRNPHTVARRQSASM